MILNGNEVNFTALGNDNTLWFYWALTGSTVVHPEQVGGAQAAGSAPAMVLSGGGVDVTAAGPGGSLYDYYALNGSANWSVGEVAPPGSINQP
jgi:hypothetical protein